MDRTSTRVTNPATPPERKKMPKKNWTQAEKKAFVKQMAAGKAAKKRGGGSKSKRTKNPGMMKGINWGDAAKNLGGVAAGSFVGFAIADFIGDMLISKLPSGVQGLGYAVSGAGVIIAGHLLQKELKKWPVAPAFAAIAAPFALRTFASYEVLPLGVKQEGAAAQMEGMGWFGKRKKVISQNKALRVPMGGSFSRNPMAGSFARNPMADSYDRPMSGSFARNPMAGTMISEDPFDFPRSRGGHGATL